MRDEPGIVDFTERHPENVRWIRVGLTPVESKGRLDSESGLAGPSDAAHTDKSVVAEEDEDLGDLGLASDEARRVRG